MTDDSSRSSVLAPHPSPHAGEPDSGIDTVHCERLRRAEFGWLVLLVLVAGFLRLAGLPGVAVSHFDEGVYVLWGMLGHYPGEEFFAPPLFPWLLQSVFAVLDPDPVWALCLSGLAGTLTVPACWWIARRWYGPEAAVASAALAALSTFHVTFSRMALTDALFLTLFLVALGLVTEVFARFEQSTSAAGRDFSGASRTKWGLVLAAGLSVGLAMNTKYNGLMPLVIASAALALVGLHGGSGLVRWYLRAALHVAAILAVALLFYVPWWWHVDSTVGYGTLLAHHRGYSGPASAWPGNMLTLLCFQWRLGGWFGFVGPGVAALMVLAMRSEQPSWRNLAVSICVALLGLVLGDGVGWLVAAIPVVVRSRSRQIPTVTHAVWLVGLVALTPLYRPYARLMLPLLGAGWVAGGAVLAQLLSRPSSEPERQRAPGWFWAAVVLAALGGVSILLVGPPTGTRAGATPDLPSACASLFRDVQDRHPPMTAFVRPPVLLYAAEYARLEQRDPQDKTSIEALFHDGGGTYLLIDLALLRDNPELRGQLERFRPRLQEIARAAYHPSLPVILDDFARECLSRNLEQDIQATYQLVLYRGIPDAP